MKIYHPGKRQKGFTLVELLVAMSITVVLVSLVVAITGTALDTWRGARNEVRAARQAKIMLDALGRDLESFVIRPNNNSQWLFARTAEDEVGPENQPSPNAATLVFLTAASDRYGGDIGGSEDKGGDISTVGYQLKFEDPIFADFDETYSKFVLYRNLVNPDNTFQGVLGQNDLEQAYDGYAGAGSDPANFMCENIYEFSIVFVVEYLDRSGDKQLVRVPIIDTGALNSADKFVIEGNGLKANGTKPVYADGAVVSVDISVTVLSDTGMRQIKNRTFNSDEAKAKFLAQNSYPYTKTVNLPRP
ncbi:MAG: PulJ/GspJ family protein [Akkermansiaceae bacterium]